MMKDYWEINVIKTTGSTEEDQNGFRMFIIQTATFVVFYNVGTGLTQRALFCLLMLLRSRLIKLKDKG